MTSNREAQAGEIRSEAERTIGQIEELAQDYQRVGVDLSLRPVNPMMGAHNNLDIAVKLAIETAPLRTLTQSTLTLETYAGGHPSIKIYPSNDPSSSVALATRIDVQPLTHGRIDKIYSGIYAVPRRVILLNRFGHQSPAKLIGKARSEAEIEVRRGITIFSRFTGRSR